MNNGAIVLAVLMGAVSVLVGYWLGYYNGLKEVDIARIKAERDMYEQRLIEWNENQKNF